MMTDEDFSPASNPAPVLWTSGTIVIISKSPISICSGILWKERSRQLLPVCIKAYNNSKGAAGRTHQRLPRNHDAGLGSHHPCHALRIRPGGKRGCLLRTASAAFTEKEFAPVLQPGTFRFVAGKERIPGTGPDNASGRPESLELRAEIALSPWRFETSGVS